MKLGLGLEWAGADLRVPVERVQLAEKLGFDSVWTAEAYGSDAFSPLAYLAGLVPRIRLGTAVVQLAARSPASTAMSAQTIDALAGVAPKWFGTSDSHLLLGLPSVELTIS